MYLNASMDKGRIRIQYCLLFSIQYQIVLEITRNSLLYFITPPFTQCESSLSHVRFFLLSSGRSLRLSWRLPSIFCFFPCPVVLDFLSSIHIFLLFQTVYVFFLIHMIDST
ncbi:hypothetical protein EUGRSUZ_H03499 [Eucalyptus grandis]|uniref:Uncharacterized protein n=2 Tax=Eucalyptus grandis TaxID=71139 RepID=A0ACC3JU41_EUCGR|nr:hypothetical protein EUGRSUZ_H03499 [Eucalyptus grandis]